MYQHVCPPPAQHSDRLPIYCALVREVYDDMTRRNPDSIPAVRRAAAKGRACKLLERAGW